MCLLGRPLPSKLSTCLRRVKAEDILYFVMSNFIITSSSSWEGHQGYLKAADQVILGSGTSTAPSSTVSLLLGSGDLSTPSSAPDTARSSLARTPLSSQAKPFVSTLDHRPFAHPWAAARWNWISQPYNEETQEDVYTRNSRHRELEEEDSQSLAYSESLQEDVYLSRTKCEQQRGRLPSHSDQHAVPTRTPSPNPVGRLSEVASAAAHWLAETVAEEVCRLAEDKYAWQKRHAVGQLEPEAQVASRQPPVKRTFIHYDAPETDPTPKPMRLVRSTSAPSILLHDTFKQQQTMQEVHQRGDCSPCAYFYAKVDGCRKGFECSFCHLCPADEIKKRKKQKIKAIRSRRRLYNFTQMDDVELELEISGA